MSTVAKILAELKSKGTEKTRATYARHRMPVERCFGVSVADMKLIAKGIKGQQALALELYATGKMEAMYLAGLVANGAKMSRQELEAWAEGAEGLPMIVDYTVPWVAVEYPQARELAMEWIGSSKDHVASSGWAAYAGLCTTVPDEALDLAEINGLLNKTVREIHTVADHVRSRMNCFVIAVGSYVMPLQRQAKEAARKIGEVSVDVGDTDCKVPLATAYIEKVEAAGKAGKKRKTIRC